MTGASKNLMGLHENLEEMTVHENYLYELTQKEFVSGMSELVNIFKGLYTGMLSEPQLYMMKNGEDTHGLEKNMNFLLQLAQRGSLNNHFLEANGPILASALKKAKVTKPMMYFQVLELLGFTVTGLEKKMEISEKITIEYPDNHDLLPVLKSMADAIGMFTKNKPHKQSSVYFELLDHRVLNHYPATEPVTTMEYLMSKLNSESREVVEMFYGVIEPLTKCNIKGSFGHYWTPTFTLRSPKRVMMSLKLTLDNHDVKLNLANLGKYTEILADFPTEIINEIIDNGWGCEGDGCNPKCAGAFTFDLNGKSYKKCRGGSFVFYAPDKNKAALLIRLLEREIEMAVGTASLD